MAASIRVLCASLMLLGLYQACGAVVLRRDYYILPSNEAIENSRELRDIKAALVKIAHRPGPDGDHERTRRQIGKLLHETKDYFEKDVFSELLSLTDNSAVCSASLVKYVTDILGILENTKDGSLNKLHRYLDFYGLQKFRLCAEKFEHDFMRETSRMYSADSVLDQFFTLAFGLEQGLSDKELHQFLSGIDFVSIRELKNKSKLRKFVEEHSTLPNFALSKAAFIENFFLKECPKVLKPLETKLTVANLAHDMRGFEIEDPDLVKINEHRRICYGFMDPKRRQLTMMNIEKLVDRRANSS